MKRLILICVTFVYLCISPISELGSQELYLNNRTPLTAKPYMELPLGAVKPEGWLKEQLQLMVNGMTGNLDTLYPEVMGERNGWLGGDGDVWERGPYWIDGLLPLAYIMNNKALQTKAKAWVEWTLQSQQPNGYFGPLIDREPESGLQRSNARDWWPKMVVLKFMKQYYDATSDSRVIDFMLNYFHYQLSELPHDPLNNWTHWGAERGGDNLMIVYWLYNLTGEKFLLTLGDLLTDQTIDWTNLFLDGKTINSLFSLHCVNLAQAIKQPIIRYQADGNNIHMEAIEQCREDLKRTHGWPIGLYGGDELLHTGNPTQGSELCTAVELMFSLEKMVEITGNTLWADWLERITFNALPTQITDNFDARQYYQQLNQVEVSRSARNFVTAYNGTGQLFGLLTGYPCCTSNLHQGWPKFTRNLWFASADGGLAAMFYSPSSVKAKVGNGTVVIIDEQTSYPFEESIRFVISLNGKKSKSVVFPLHLRIPSWCPQAVISINGSEWDKADASSVVRIDREWKNGDIVRLLLPMQVSVSRWYEASAVVERGPLVYALKIGEEWKKAECDTPRYGSWYYEVYPTTPWNYCLKAQSIREESISDSFRVIQRPVDGYPWNLENAPIEIHTSGKRIEQWQMYSGSAGPLPYSVQRQAGMQAEEQITLVPYGCTTLRITEFPVTDR